MSNQPAILSGIPTFNPKLPINFPTLPPFSRYARRLKPSWESGIVTNGPLVAEFESQVSKRLGGVETVAVSSCTTGLILLWQALQIKGEVLLPSLTFSASMHSLFWNRLKPVFGEVRESDGTLDPEKIILPKNHSVGALFGVHLYGNPCRIEELEKLAKKLKIPLVFDGAHALGALYRGRPVGGFGTAEVFSLSPTKCIHTGEGGLVTTRDKKLADKIRLLRKYGDPGDYNCLFPGLNGRMSELHAALGLENLPLLEKEINWRQKFVATLEPVIRSLPGLRLATVDSNDLCTFKDYSLFVDPKEFGLDRNQLAVALTAEGIDSRFYFFPPQHQQKAYPDEAKEAKASKGSLPITEKLSQQVICLPIFSKMGLNKVKQIGEALTLIHQHSSQIKNTLKKMKEN